MAKRNILLTVGLAVSALLLLFLMAGQAQQVIAINNAPRALAQGITHTVYIPSIARNYNPDYIPSFGIIMYGNVDNANGLQQMQDAGSKWITTKLDWSSIEATEGIYDWSGFDTKAQNAQAAGMDLFVLFTENPSWAASLPGGPVTDTQDLVDFVTLMAERYDCDGIDDASGSPCVNYWSFYAEPDNGDLGRAKQGKGYWGHNGSGYAAMLYQISPAIHSANPRAQVLIGGLAYDYFEEDNPSNPFVRDFLTDTLTALNTYPGGADTYLNAVAFHFYPISADRWPTIREKTWEIAGIMTNHGVGDLPLISPEMGYWSSSKHGSSEEGQARRLAQMYARSLSVGLHSLSWYKVFDDAVAGSIEDEYPDSTSGLFRLNGSKKPSYYAYQTMTEELHGAIYSRELGAAGAEGYVFDMLDGKEKTVVWSSSGTVHVDFSYSHVRLVDTQGNVFDIQDGDTTTPGDLDGSVNGVIRLEIHENQPYYVGQE